MIETEEELIEEYADTDLSARRAFLISGKDPVSSVRKTLEKAYIKYFRRPALPIAIFLIVVISSLAWAYYSRNSIDRQTTAALDNAYTDGRRLESRISGLKYAPLTSTRGEKEKQKSETLLSTERDLLGAVIKDRSGENLHALGRLYLANGEFKQAIDRLEGAKALTPEKAEVLNDLGASYLEESRRMNPAERNPLHLLQALEHFDKAVALDPRLLPAYFNRANCLQLSNLPKQALESWKKYLEFDPDSGWSAEARKRIDSLDSVVRTDIATDPEREFLNAFHANNDSAALLLAGQNRELIKTNYLPQLLVMSFVKTGPGERAEKIAALKYLGTLEDRAFGDKFASDLAGLYERLPEEKIKILEKAQDAVKLGYKLCLENDFNSARDQFNIARELFLAAGDLIEAHTIADYFIAYSIYRTGDRLQATDQLEKIARFSEKNKYKWFSLMNYYWILGGQESLGKKTVTQIIRNYEDALQTAREMGDAYMTQKFIESLIIKYDFVRQEKKTFGYVSELLEFSTHAHISERQKYRNFDRVIQVMSKSNFSGFARAVAMESVSFSPELMTDPSFAMAAQLNAAIGAMAAELSAGIAFSQIGDLDEAEKRLLSARDLAQKLQSKLKDRDLARISSALGNLERKKKDFRKALEYYDEALKLSENPEATAADKARTGYDRYEIRKFRLLTFQAAGDLAAVEQEIPLTIKLAEEYRDEIQDEQERLSFFDDQQAVYDAAVDFEMDSGRDENAFNYAEVSNSRSLSDWLAKGARIHTESDHPKILFNDSTKPLDLQQIREAMPASVQIIQYRLLEDRIVIWLISKENFRSFSSPLDSGEMKKKVEEYIDLIRKPDDESRPRLDEMAREFYRLLIDPVREHLDPDREICIIPNKELFYIPFSSLLSPQGKYFIEEFVLLYSPGANVFLRSTLNALSKETNTNEWILSVGNPSFDHDDFPKLDDLRDAEDEARAITKNYPGGSLLLRGGDATKKAFLTAYKDYDIIHFAGHYIVEPDSPLRSKLVMSKGSDVTADGVLTNLDLLGEKLPKTRLVVLSACQTGVEDYYGGEGLVGLSRTFLAIGTPLVIGSAWKVDSAATNPLMQSFHKHRKESGQSSVKALRAAQLDMLHDNRSNYSSPYYWAAFSAFGGYTNF
jgi:CHAT domain-containing protein/cytochrome c-type biogenesis protein CcmH/NrfG